jgi:hypothetical protein
MDINKATPADPTLTLGLAKEDSEKLVKIRPYKTIEELATKAGIAKVTVDKISRKGHRRSVTISPYYGLTRPCFPAERHGPVASTVV